MHKAYLIADPLKHKLAIKEVKDGLLIKLSANAAQGISTTVVLKIQGAVSVEAAPKIEVSASNTYQNETSQYGPQFAFDGDPDTRWATDDSTSQAWIAFDLITIRSIRGVRIKEAYAGRVQTYELQYRTGTTWKTFLSGATLSANFEVTFPAVKAREFRLNILSAKQGPTIQEIEWFE